MIVFKFLSLLLPFANIIRLDFNLFDLVARRGLSYSAHILQLNLASQAKALRSLIILTHHSVHILQAFV